MEGKVVRIKRPSISLQVPSPPLSARLRWAACALASAAAVQCENEVMVAGAFALFAGLLAYEITPGFGRLLQHAGRCGKDLNKADMPTIPESVGIAVGAVYVMVLFMFLPVPFLPWLVRGAAPGEFPFERLGAYTAALLSITCMLFLGFADDVLNLKWRHKIILPAMAALPLLMIYSVTCGRTEVVVPHPLRALIGNLVELGPGYYIYMALLSIFCTHSINILAGVNGVEVGQSLIIAFGVILHALLAIRHGEPPQAHHFTLILMLPFATVSMALLRHNWYPARVFVGDTYCYFAGMTLAVCGILGHFGKTLLLFFLPQIVNFVYSLPQLFAILPCPRHRLPQLDPSSGALHPSTVTFTLGPANRWLVRLLCRLHLLQITSKVKDELTTNNLTLLNLLLVHFGPLREDRLTMLMMAIQSLICLLSLLLRFYIAPFFFP